MRSGLLPVRTVTAVVALGALLLGPAAPVLGAEPGTSSPRPDTNGDGYPAQIVLADFAGGLVVGGVLSIATKNAAPVLLTWSLASPTVHVVHGHPGRGAVSLLLHVGLPILGVFAGVKLANCPANTGDDSDAFCGLGEALAFGVLGMVTATAVDAAVLGQMHDESPRAVVPASAPALTVGRNGDVSVGWRGTF